MAVIYLYMFSRETLYDDTLLVWIFRDDRAEAFSLYETKELFTIIPTRHMHTPHELQRAFHDRHIEKRQNAAMSLFEQEVIDLSI